jgi:glutamate decarboxylase
MKPECDKIMLEATNKNYADMDEYPVTTEIQNRCVNIIARLFNAPAALRRDGGRGRHGRLLGAHHAGRAGVRAAVAEHDEGDREAIRQAQHRHGRQRVRVCWEKFARYFEVRWSSRR